MAPIAPALITSARQRAAAHLGTRVEDLRLIDYRHALGQGVSGPTLAEVLATFGTWKTARDAASRR
jgi:hypothetical protein